MKIIKGKDGIYCATARGILRPCVAEGSTWSKAVTSCWELLSAQQTEKRGQL